MITYLVTKSKTTNLPLLIEEFMTAHQADGAVSVAAYLDGETEKYIFICEDDSTVIQGDCDTIYAAHVGTALTMAQYIDAQIVAAQSSAKSALYALRSEDPDDMWAIKLGRLFRDYEGDSYTINTDVQALTYINTKFRQMLGEVSDQVIIEYDGGTPSWNTPASRLANAFRAVFTLILLVSEWTSDGQSEE